MGSDRELIGRVLGGDPESFRGLVERYQSRLLGFARSLLHDAAEAEDAVQETFLAAYRHLHTFDPGRGSFAAWLFRIARNRSLNRRKRKLPVPVARVPEGPAPAEADGEAGVFRKLDAALADLPFAQRTAFTLAELQGFSYEEVSRIEEVPLGTVRSRIARAREKLRAALLGRRCG